MREDIYNSMHIGGAGIGFVTALGAQKNLFDAAHERYQKAADVAWEFVNSGRGHSPNYFSTPLENDILFLEERIANKTYTQLLDADRIGDALVARGFAESISTAAERNDILDLTHEMWISGGVFGVASILTALLVTNLAIRSISHPKKQALK